MKGGARRGAGRKRGTTKRLVNFKPEESTLTRLRASVPRGAMTRFVEQALQRALDHLPAAESRSREYKELVS
jgi:hypothetical protein